VPVPRKYNEEDQVASEETARERGCRVMEALPRNGLDLGFQAVAEYPGRGRPIGRRVVTVLLAPP
jgi:hypothetical protein